MEGPTSIPDHLGDLTQREKDFIHRLPKAELHLHLEGTIGPSTLVELSRRVDEVPLTQQEAEKIYVYDDFRGFLVSFEAVVQRLRGPTEYELVAERMIQQLGVQGVVHAEVYFAVGELLQAKAQSGESDSEIFGKYMEALERARVQGERDHGVSIYWIIDTSRHNGPELARRVFALAAEYRATYSSIVGIGLGGDERVFASEPFRGLLEAASAVGLRITNHAGENTPASFIWEALAVGSERLRHAVSAANDTELIAELKRRRVPLEMNPTSNVVLKNVSSLKVHPLRPLFDEGLLVTINSDDPAFFGSNVENEYWLAHSELMFTMEELRQLARNSFVASFLPEEQKVKWVTAVENVTY
jgi:aminodeoxyfutalosine deaminase